ncbi:hypothetical protein BDN70DRAFT_223812 [Pholiota conissans]|uniref:Uncharacterized protein n=1 Tax=Pholiota conissans TaxID=109636 RepID=A0A9P6CXL7_9AGAR|nr:hypothetical protein BDN70DRAFT_223812 [Pholiota conissans]
MSACATGSEWKGRPREGDEGDLCEPIYSCDNVFSFVELLTLGRLLFSSPSSCNSTPMNRGRVLPLPSSLVFASDTYFFFVRLFVFLRFRYYHMFVFFSGLCLVNLIVCVCLGSALINLSLLCDISE